MQAQESRLLVRCRDGDGGARATRTDEHQAGAAKPDAAPPERFHATDFTKHLGVFQQRYNQVITDCRYMDGRRR